MRTRLLSAITGAVCNWEHGWTVGQRHLPRTIAFLDDNPICWKTTDLLERLAWYQQVNGLTLGKLAAVP